MSNVHNFFFFFFPSGNLTWRNHDWHVDRSGSFTKRSYLLTFLQFFNNTGPGMANQVEIELPLYCKFQYMFV